MSGQGPGLGVAQAVHVRSTVFSTVCAGAGCFQFQHKRTQGMDSVFVRLPQKTLACSGATQHARCLGPTGLKAMDRTEACMHMHMHSERSPEQSEQPVVKCSRLLLL
jgi:hypothetical protein